MKLKKGDQVKVLSGKDKGRQAKIQRLFPKSNTVLIPDINQYIKHQKSKGDKQPGERLTLNRPISASRLALICPKCQQVTRVGYKIISDQKKRICRKCDNEV